MTTWFGKKAWRGVIFGGVVGLGIGGVAGFGLGVYFLPILTAGPSPDYRLYLTLQFVDAGAAFMAIKSAARQIGPIETFENFALDLPPGLDLDDYQVVVIWCEAFQQFITAAKLEN